MAEFLGQKGRCVCWKCMCSMLACSFYSTCNILKWDLVGFLTSCLFFGVLQNVSWSLMKSHEVSWSLVESHWVSWFNVCQSWGVGRLLEHPRVWSTPRVSAPRWVGSSSLGHPRHGSQWYEVVLCQCADCAVWDAHSNGMGVGWVLHVHCSSIEDVDKWR